jgi:uncharacterized protein (TIGR03435 family)
MELRSSSAPSIAMKFTITTGLIAASLCAVAVLAQTAPQIGGSLKFEVASVKSNTSGDGRVMIGVQPGGRYTATNVPLRFLIRNAYAIQDFQLVGAPDWIDSERFDIIAKAERDIGPPIPGGPPSPLQLMLRSLLEDRFRLALHRDTRELPIYALVLARPDGKLGPQLQPSKTDCSALAGARGRNGLPPDPPSTSGRPPCGMRMMPGQLAAGGFPISQLAQQLSQSAQRVVIDRTGLTGNYDFDLKWTPDQLPQGAPPGAPAPAIDPNGPSLFTAVQEQLGLKLESTKGPVEVLVVDRVERPTPD